MSSSVSYTLTQMTEALQNWCEDTGTEFTSTIPELIRLGESRVATDLNIEIFDRTVVTTAVPGQPEQAVKGPRCQGVRSVWIRDPADTDPGPPIVITEQGPYRYLEQRSLDWCRDYVPDLEEGEPLYYAELDEDALYLVPVPDDEYRVFARIITAPESLTDVGDPDEDTTWLSRNAGDLLLWGTLIGTDKYLKSDNTIQEMWMAEYQRLLEVRRVLLRNVIRSEYHPVKPAAKAVE